MNLSNNIVGADLPHVDADHQLQRILTAALPHQNNYVPAPKSNYWDAEFFNLDQVKIFQEADADEQVDILKIANLSLLTESYFIEKAGVGYMAKMVLLSETVEERILYGLFSADEANHLQQISYFLPKKAVINLDDPFLNLLSEVVESGDKAVLLFVLQVVLEGWGLSHYRRLATKCRYPVLADIFTGFLQAESRHHAVGTTSFNQVPISSSSEVIILDILAKFLLMVQVGPQSILTAIEQVKGHLTHAQKVQILEELDTETHSGIRLKILRSLINITSANRIMEILESQGFFQPLPPHKCI